MERQRSVVIAAGGTGGHIFPGLALADALETLEPTVRVSFVGTPRGLESQLIPDAGYELDLVKMVPFAGLNRLKVPLAVPIAVSQSLRILRHRKASVAVGMGGYASLPLIAAARLKKIPSIIHESGATLGRANLLSARLTPNIALAFVNIKGSFPGGIEPRVIGMPLRADMSAFDRRELRGAARKEFGIDPNENLVLVFGGSQGAASLNELAIGLAKTWQGRGIKILLKTGPRQLDEIRSRIERDGTRDVIECVSFIEKMPFAFAAADFAITRAGAGTVAELAVAGLPALLVPYPYAPGDHQALNARELIAANGAFLIRDSELDADRIGKMIEEVLTTPGKLTAMANGAASVARPHAAEELARWVLQLAV